MIIWEEHTATYNRFIMRFPCCWCPSHDPRFVSWKDDDSSEEIVWGYKVMKINWIVAYLRRYFAQKSEATGSLWLVALASAWGSGFSSEEIIRRVWWHETANQRNISGMASSCVPPLLLSERTIMKSKCHKFIYNLNNEKQILKTHGPIRGQCLCG